MDTSRAQKITGHTFKDVTLLERALTHPSYAHQYGKTSYDRLEFLGDSIMGAVVSAALYDKYPDADSGELTNMRKAIVSKEPVSQTEAALELQFCIDCIEGVPLTAKKMCDVFEAVVGALYKDGGYPAAEKFVLNVLGKHIDNPYFTDYKSAVNEKYGTHEYVLLDNTADGVTVALIVEGMQICTGKGRSKKEAEVACARNAVEGRTE